MMNEFNKAYLKIIAEENKLLKEQTISFKNNKDDEEKSKNGITIPQTATSRMRPVI